MLLPIAWSGVLGAGTPPKSIGAGRVKSPCSGSASTSWRHSIRAGLIYGVLGSDDFFLTRHQTAICLLVGSGFNAPHQPEPRELVWTTYGSVQSTISSLSLSFEPFSGRSFRPPQLYPESAVFHRQLSLRPFRCCRSHLLQPSELKDQAPEPFVPEYCIVSTRLVCVLSWGDCNNANQPHQ